MVTFVNRQLQIQYPQISFTYYNSYLPYIIPFILEGLAVDSSNDGVQRAYDKFVATIENS